MKKYGIIYKIENKINGKIYIGQTTLQNGFDQRYKNNIKKYTHNVHLKNSIEKYGINNFEIIKELDIAYSKQELNEKEKFYISLYKSTNKDFGYNKMSGGDNSKMSEETKNKMSKNKTSENNPMAKKVVCLNTMEEFNTFREAAEKYNLSKSAISGCCNGKTNTAGKLNGERLIWMKKEKVETLTTEEIKNIINEEQTKRKEMYSGKNNSKAKKVKCINDGKIFNTGKECAEYYNLSVSKIYAKIKENKPYKNLNFCYVE